MSEHLWYEELRHSYRPASTQVVFVGESVPDPGAGHRRFFYSPELTHDNLFRGIMLSLYGAGSSGLRDRKPDCLGRFQRDGFWLLDVAERPLNKLSPGERSQARRLAAGAAIARIVEAEPLAGVIVCHGPTFSDLVASGAKGRLHLLHDTPIPFPLGNWRGEFVVAVRDALATVGIQAPLELVPDLP